MKVKLLGIDQAAPGYRDKTVYVVIEWDKDGNSVILESGELPTVEIKDRDQPIFEEKLKELIEKHRPLNKVSII